MSALNDPNGSFMYGLRKVSDLVLVNVAFCAVSLPVITAGAALTGLHSSMQLIAADADDEEGAVKTFFRSFKENFVPSTLLWLVMLAAAAFLALYRMVVQSMTGPLGTMYQVTFYVLLLVFAFGFQYVFPIEARFRLRTRDVLKNAWLLSIAAAPWTLLTLAITGVAVYLTFFMNPTGFSMAVFVWAVCGFSVITFLESLVFLRTFRTKLGISLLEMAPDSGEKAEGALFTDEAHRKEDLMIQESSYSMPEWNRREDPGEAERQKRRRKETRSTGR